MPVIATARSAGMCERAARHGFGGLAADRAMLLKIAAGTSSMVCLASLE